MKHLADPRKTRKHELTGERLCLREVMLSDVEGPYLQWMNDAEVLRYTESRFHPHSQAQLCDYVTRINASPDFVFRAITLRDTGRHIGNIKLGPIDWNQGYAAESIQLLAGYAFGSLKLHKLTASCYAVNIGAIKTLKKAGFEQLEKDDKYFSDGKAVDVVWFRILEPHHG